MPLLENIYPPDNGFNKFIIYREPYEDKTIWLLFPEEEESYKIDLRYLRRWMMPLFDNDIGFVNTSLDHFWNFYHCQFEPGVWRVTTLPLCDAYSYNLGSDGLDLVTKLANRIRSMF